MFEVKYGTMQYSRTSTRTVQAGGGGGGYNILARTTRLAQSLGNVPLIRN